MLLPVFCFHIVAPIIIAISALPASARAQNQCKGSVYLTLDTGHMAVAPLVADVLRRQHVRATFFAANERTQEGDGSLGDHWAPWWRARAAEGHEFASHTWDHTYWRADLGSAQQPAFRVRPSAGARAGQDFVLTAAKYCRELDKAADRLKQVTGKTPLPLFRAPGGKTSPQLLAAAQSCGYAHVGWSPAGFLGDELPSDRFSNAALLNKALRDVRDGDILLAHLGIWSRKDPWAPAVLEPLIEGLKSRGLCFKTLREHPDYPSQLPAQRHR
ncbi:polysaccharide deacetylase family protein [Paracidovorax sp. MALMAid1276]|uniref:polysaccharide deacetylase family protein n=1 Tax=Paracidovorax sp. MALMAid1276 TaxID=3411631 RepID=UPI003B9B48CB